MQENSGAKKPSHLAGGKPPAVKRPAGLMRLGALALHPFLLAAASVFVLYASNLHELYFADVVTVLAAALGAALVLFLVFGAALRSFGAKAAILASTVLVPTLFYVEIVHAVNRNIGTDLSPATALPFILTTVAIIVLAVSWARIDFTPLNAALNGIAVVMLLVPAWHIAAHEWKAGAPPFRIAAFNGGAHAAADAALVIDPEKAKTAPDIYYFIFDRYGSQSNLAAYYDFDNAELMDFLKAKGFHVASDSHSNYLKTAHSLASTFNMDYLDVLKEDRRSKIGDWHPIYDMVKDHRVGRFLKSNGYEFIQVGAWWGPTHYNASAHENYSFGFSEFEFWYIRKTILPTLLDLVAPSSTYAHRMQWELGQCQRVPRQIEKIKEIKERKASTFVFAHILVPHDPYVFAADGRCLSFDAHERRSERDGYVDQIRYTNSLIKDFVSALLSGAGPKPIIIIQADEGPFPERYRRNNRSWHEATADELKIKTGILNAYYFPDGDYRDLDQQVTSVNTFRILFNKYFGTKLERLPDRIFAFPDYFKIYDFYEITDVVGGAPSVTQRPDRLP